jgi:hypothetical protein
VSLASLSSPSPGEFVASVVLSTAVSMLIYWHASRHGSKHATAWGVATFLALPLMAPIYFIHYYATRRRI